MLNFCLEKNITLYFNAVFTPEEFSLKEQPLEMQEKIIAFLKCNPAPEMKGNLRSPRNLSINAYNDFIKQLEGWIKDRRNLLEQKEIKVSQIKHDPDISSNLKDDEAWSEANVQRTIIDLIEMEKTGYFEKEKEKQLLLVSLLKDTTEAQLPLALLQYIIVHEKYQGEKAYISVEMKRKISEIATIIYSSPYKEMIINRMALAPPFVISKVFLEKSIDELKKELNFFN
jgi:hypothetical protein